MNALRTRARPAGLASTCTAPQPVRSRRPGATAVTAASIPRPSVVDYGLLTSKKAPLTGSGNRSTAAKASGKEPDASDENARLGFFHPDRRHFGEQVRTLTKAVPLLLMFFCILFNYTILRDTKVRCASFQQSDFRVSPSLRLFERTA